MACPRAARIISTTSAKAGSSGAAATIETDERLLRPRERRPFVTSDYRRDERPVARVALWPVGLARYG